MKHITHYNRPVLLIVLLLSCCFTFLVSCKKNLVGEGDFDPNELTVSLPEGIRYVMLGVEDAEPIKPIIKFRGETMDASNYKFLWKSLYNQDTMTYDPELSYHDLAGQETTLISYMLTVEDKKTGISAKATGSLFLTTPTREGWVLLTEKAGKANLGMLTYTPDGYEKFIDIQSELGVNLALKGKPVSIAVIGAERSFTDGKFQHLGIATDEDVQIVQAQNMVAHVGASNYVKSILNPDAFDPISMEANGASIFIATKGNNSYYFDMYRMISLNQYTQRYLNSYTPTNFVNPRFVGPKSTLLGPKPFSNEYNRLVFNEDAGAFVSSTPTSSTNTVFTLVPLPPVALTGFKMVAMSTKAGIGGAQDQMVALLHNPATQASYVLHFLTNKILTSYKTISYEKMKDILASKFVEIDHNANYFIYTKGSKVMGYDYVTDVVVDLLDVGNEEISFIKLTKFIPETSKVAGRAEVYRELLKKLVVCTYNPTSPDNSGVFRLFNIPLANQPLVLDTEEKGFPKIVSTTFATIP